MGARANVSWPVALNRDRVGMAFITLSLAGKITVPIEHLSDTLKAHGFPQVAYAVRDQLRRGRTHDINAIGPNNPNTIRALVKNIIKENSNGR